MKFFYGLLLVCVVVHTSTDALEFRNPGSVLGNFFKRIVQQPKQLLVHAKNYSQSPLDRIASTALRFKVNRFLENAREKMPEGIPALGVPVLEPFALDYYEFDIHNNVLGDLEGYVRDVKVHHLSKFELERVNMTFAGPKISCAASLPKIYITGRYKISGMFGNRILLKGAGPMDITISGLNFSATTTLRFSRGMYMKSFDMDYSIDSLRVNLKNLFEKKTVGDLINKIISQEAPAMLKLIRPDILPQIRDYVGGAVNSTIHNLSLEDMLRLLTGTIYIP